MLDEITVLQAATQTEFAKQAESRQNVQIYARRAEQP